MLEAIVTKGDWWMLCGLILLGAAWVTVVGCLMWADFQRYKRQLAAWTRHLGPTR